MLPTVPPVVQEPVLTVLNPTITGAIAGLLFAVVAEGLPRGYLYQFVKRKVGSWPADEGFRVFCMTVLLVAGFSSSWKLTSLMFDL